MGIDRTRLSDVVGQRTVKDAGRESSKERDYVFIAERIIKELGRDDLQEWLRYRKFNWKERDVLFAKFIEGYNDRALASLLGMSLGDVMHLTEKTAKKFVDRFSK